MAIYAHMTYTAPCVILFVRAAFITRASGKGWALEIETFLGPVEWHRADGRVAFEPKKASRYVTHFALFAQLAIQVLGRKPTSRKKQKKYLQPITEIASPDSVSLRVSEIRLVISLAHQELLTKLLLVMNGQFGALFSLLRSSSGQNLI